MREEQLPRHAHRFRWKQDSSRPTVARQSAQVPQQPHRLLASACPSIMHECRSWLFLFLMLRSWFLFAVHTMELPAEEHVRAVSPHRQLLLPLRRHHFGEQQDSTKLHETNLPYSAFSIAFDLPVHREYYRHVHLKLCYASFVAFLKL